jgi:hypothetical protein
MKEYKFNAKIEQGRGGGAFVKVPVDAKREFKTGGQVKVKATFDGEPYRGSLAPMGEGTHILGVRKAIRQKIGKDIGDTVAVTFVQDIARRTVTLPKELRTALSRNPTARVTFTKLSYTHKREYAEWVAEAKKDETRKRRASKAIGELLKKSK